MRQLALVKVKANESERRRKDVLEMDYRTSDTVKALVWNGLTRKTVGAVERGKEKAAGSDERAEPLSAAASRGGDSAGDVRSGIRLVVTNDHPAMAKGARKRAHLAIVGK